MKLSRSGLRKLIESVVNEQQEFKPSYTESDALLHSELHGALSPELLGLIGKQKKFVELRSAYRTAGSKRSVAVGYVNPQSELSLNPRALSKEMEKAEDAYDAQAKEVETMYKNHSESDLFKDNRGNKIEFDYFGNLTAFKYHGTEDGASSFKKFGDPETAAAHVKQVYKNCDEFENHYNGFIP